MADLPSPGTIRTALKLLQRIGRNRLRAYRRMRWKRQPDWVARTDRRPPQPDIILLGIGSRQKNLALWEVHGPRDEYLLQLDGSAAVFIATDFPAAGFTGRSGGAADVGSAS
jgi:hypothetical protein